MCEKYTRKYSTYRVAQHDHTSSREHAWLKAPGSRGERLRIAHLCVLKQLSSPCHVSFLAAPDTDHKHKFSVTYPPIFPTTSPTHARLLVHDPYLPCEVPRQSGGPTQIPSLAGYEPKAFETEAIEPGSIELDTNLGTDPCQIQERFMSNNYNILSLKIWMNLEKLCPTSSLRELRKMSASPLYMQSR